MVGVKWTCQRGRLANQSRISLVLWRAAVVHDEVDVEVGRHVALDRVEELAELLRAVAGHAFADDRSGLHVERGEQRGRAVPLVVVGAPLGLAGPHRQQRLGAVQRLDLAFLVDAEHHGALRRVEIEPDDVAHLLHEQRIGRELEGLDAVRLQAEGAPDAMHGRGRMADRLGHGARGSSACARSGASPASCGSCRRSRRRRSGAARPGAARRRGRPSGARRTACAMCRLSLRRRRPWPRSLCC